MNWRGVEMAIDASCIQALFDVCIRYSTDALEKLEVVPPMLVMAGVDRSGEKEVLESASMLEAGVFHQTEDGSGKEVMMKLIGLWLEGDERALGLVSQGEAGQMAVKPELIAHVSEAWVVVQSSTDAAIPESVANHPDRQEFVMVQLHQTGNTIMGSAKIETNEAGKRRLGKIELHWDQESFGRLFLGGSAVH